MITELRNFGGDKIIIQETKGIVNSLEACTLRFTSADGQHIEEVEGMQLTINILDGSMDIVDYPEFIVYCALLNKSVWYSKFVGRMMEIQWQ